MSRGSQVRWARWLVLAIALPLSQAVGAQGGPTLEVGIERVALDFPAGLPMWGYTPRPNRGLLDPLYARVFLFRLGDQSVALVTLDLGRTFGSHQMNPLRDRVRRSVGVRDVIFTASHTHSGPYLRDEYPGGGIPAWETAVVEDIAAAIERASRSTFEARLAVGKGRVEIGHNRRHVGADGAVRMLWANPSRTGTYPVDPEVTVLRIDDSAGEVRGVLVGYACHPVVFGPDNLDYSADFPGAMSSFVSRHLPGHPIVGFLQGGAGDINPFEDKRRLREDAVRIKNQVGEILGQEVLRVARRLSTARPQRPSIREHRMTMALRSRAHPQAERIDADLTVLLLNERYAFVGLPGEPFIEFQLDLKRALDFEASFLMGYTNGYVRYFPTIRAAVEGGYGADRTVSIVEVGAGELMMRQAYVELLKMSGALRSRPQPDR